MAIRNINSTLSMKRLCFVLAIMILVMGAQFRVVHCRKLRSTSRDTRIAGSDQRAGEGDSMGMTQLAASSRNQSCRKLRSTSRDTRIAGSDQRAGEGDSMGMTQLAASSRNGLSKVRRLVFKLASGPSKKGPGH